MNDRAIFFAALFILLSAGGTAAFMKTRGLRNNNPGNLRRNTIKWDGLAVPQTDNAFFQFTTPDYGIRAMAKVLVSYQDRYGLNTVRQIINRYAPPSENDTAGYIDDVSARLNVSPDAPLIIRRVMPDLIRAIIRHENGVQPYSIATISNGISMAGVIV